MWKVKKTIQNRDSKRNWRRSMILMNQLKTLSILRPNSTTKTIYQKIYKNFKTNTSKIESVDTVFIIRATTTSVTLSVTGVGLIVVPSSAEIYCALWLCAKVIHKAKFSKYKNTKNNLEKINKFLNLLDPLDHWRSIKQLNKREIIAGPFLAAKTNLMLKFF